MKKCRLKFSVEAQAEFLRFDKELNAMKIAIPGLDNHVKKYGSLYLGLCIVHHMMTVAEKHSYLNPLTIKNIPTLVDANTTRSVHNLVMNFFLPHARKIYGYFGEHPGREVAEKIADWIVQKKVTSFKRKDVAPFAPQSQIKLLDAPFEYLEQMGWVRVEERGRVQGKGGRPGESIMVNPKVLERFGGV